jgi:hypothetical protein
MIRGNQVSHDTSIFPICFLYRQYLELSLKDMYLYYSAQSDDEKASFLRKTNHSLLNVWENNVAPMISPLMTHQPQIDEFNLVAGYIKDFQSLDADSYIFRYPINKKERKLYHTTPMKLNIIGLMRKMDKIEHFLSFVSTMLDIEKMQKEVAF